MSLTLEKLLKIQKIFAEKKIRAENYVYYDSEEAQSLGIKPEDLPNNFRPIHTHIDKAIIKATKVID